jgi:hypothetical protein
MGVYCLSSTVLSVSIFQPILLFPTPNSSLAGFYYFDLYISLLCLQLKDAFHNTAMAHAAQIL